VISALATLAYEGRRADFFRSELMNALKVIDADHIEAEEMKGSWAGAMGQNQFMPSSFLKFAVDGDADGRIDTWNDLSDVFASTPKYLKKSGGRRGEPGGVEEKMSQAIPKSLTGPNNEKPLSYWSHMGVNLPGGPPPGPAALVVPDGGNGRA